MQEINPIHYIRDLVGVDFIALGSGFGGAINAPFSAEGYPMITEALLRVLKLVRSKVPES